MQNVTRMTARTFSDEIVLAATARLSAAHGESFTRGVDTKDSQSARSAERMLCTATVNARGDHAGCCILQRGGEEWLKYNGLNKLWMQPMTLQPR